MENVSLAKYGNCATYFLKYILDNLAYRKTTAESSTYSGHSPSYGVDGLIAAVDTYDLLVTHTQNKKEQFWMVDLGDTYDIQWIELYNRQNNRKYLFIQHHVQVMVTP